MTWTQIYDPLGSPLWSPLLAAVPVVLLLGLLASGRASAERAALAGFLAAALMAVLFYMPSEAADRGAWATTVLAAAGYGAAFGLLPIGWIVLAAIFLYTLTVETGQFEIVKQSVASLSADRRIQALLIAFSFGAFVEGAAGFGTPVAISAALMMGAGFKPLHAAGLALLANTSPVAFGALGTPIKTLAEVTGLSEIRLSAMAGRQLPIFSLIVPAWLVWVMAGWRGMIEVWPALLVCGGTFAGVQFAVANFHGPWLVDVIAGLASLIALALFLRVWQPRHIFQFADERETNRSGGRGSRRADSDYTRKQIASAWVPWGLLTAFVFVWGLPEVKEALGTTSPVIEVPELHLRIARDRPVVRERAVENALYRFDWLSATGTGIFFASVLSAFWLQVTPARFVRVFWTTCRRMRWPLFTIACMLAIAFTTRYSGMDATLGLAFTRTGALYPMFAAMLGWLGVALTGSDTSSNALFGSLQTITADQLSAAGGPLQHLGADSAKVLLATANSTGGVMGKMIDAQSIVVAAAAIQQPGQEGPILRFVFLHSLVLAILMGGLVMLQAYVWTASIP
ncbi:MAG: L-lactate permease [Planctomycetes bacterium]|nr:L-lactate permease [Planctomycetota bacterium]